MNASPRGQIREAVGLLSTALRSGEPFTATCGVVTDMAIDALRNSVILSREQADTIQDALERARVSAIARLADKQEAVLSEALALLREAREAGA